MDGSYGIRDNVRYSGPFRSSTLLHSKSGALVNTSSTRAGSMIQMSAAISASSWPGPQPANPLATFWKWGGRCAEGGNGSLA